MGAEKKYGSSAILEKSPYTCTKKNILTGFEKYLKISFIHYFLFIVNISLLVHYVIVAVIAIFPTYMTSVPLYNVHID